MIKRHCILKATVCVIFAFIANILPAASETPLEKDTLEAMKKATLFYRNKVSTHGGYLYEYTVDMKYRYGEMPARDSQIWVQDPATPRMGQVYIDAYEATGDPVYFEAADAAARALIRGQMDCGGWNYLIDFKAGSLEDWYANEGHHPDYNEFSHFDGNATFDDGVTYAPIMLLLRLYDMTSDPVYIGPLEKALDFVLEAQFLIGGWTQRFPVLGTGYDSYFTYNDGVINNNIELLIKAYMILVKPKYLESIRRAGNFIILSQRPGPQYGWGQQHDHTLELASGRVLEPAAVGPPETIDNVWTLMDIYELTGDRRYLEPVGRSLDWLDSIIGDDGPVPRFIEEGTGRPMAAKYTGDSGSYESIEITYDLSEGMGGYGWVSRNFSTKKERERYNRLISTPWQGLPQEKQTSLSKAESLKRSQAMEKDVLRIIGELDEHGRWTEDGRMHTKRFCFKNVVEYTGPVMKNGWIRTRTFIRNMNSLSEYISLKKIARDAD